MDLFSQNAWSDSSNERRSLRAKRGPRSATTRSMIWWCRLVIENSAFPSIRFRYSFFAAPIDSASTSLLENYGVSPKLSACSNPLPRPASGRGVGGKGLRSSVALISGFDVVRLENIGLLVHWSKRSLSTSPNAQAKKTPECAPCKEEEQILTIVA